ncbi:WbqC family protein [Seonamhaeicola sp. ML3]|uniref:WbqC family protein n=1 Tax=Seonamhaeicola sp. ML3 TaxID=2937786 RepID=UPI0020103CC2|nr:WbqC family protein [Seonamhaeicola sp. ML3]
MKKIAILQSNYIPWKGYFDLIASVDEFIIYDEMQYTKNDWRNRNKIKTPTGVSWITIPVRVEKLSQTINQTQISNNNWVTKHIKTLQANYAKAKYFKNHKDFVFDLYHQASKTSSLSEINFIFIENICNFLNIKTKLSFSTDYNLIEGKTERLIDLIKQSKGTSYISGPAAKSYIDENLFNDNNLNLEWMDYSKYKEYNQLYPPFEHGVSILDLIFNEGENSSNFLTH